MMKEEKTKIFIISIIVILLIVVFAVGVSKAYKIKEENKATKVSFVQLFSDKYNLTILDENYFVASLKNDELSAILNIKEEKVIELDSSISYNGVFNTKDGNYLFYDNDEDKLITYTFDGTNFGEMFNIEDVPYAKPIVFIRGEQKYIIGFCSNVEDDLYLYIFNNSGTIVINNASLVADYEQDGVYYVYSNNYLVVNKKDGLYGAIDLQGNVVIDYDYKNLLNTYGDSFIAVNGKGKYGIIGKDGKTILDFKYQAISLEGNYYLVVNNNNKMALFDSEYKNLTDFVMDYDTLVDFDLRSKANSIKLWNVGTNQVVVNNYLEDYNKTEYKNHMAYFIKNGKVINKVKEVGFKSNKAIYSYDKDYNFVFYDTNLTELYSFKMDDVKKITKVSYIKDNIVKIDYINTDDEEEYKYFDNGEEIEFNYGDVVYVGDDFFAAVKDNKDYKEINIYDKDNKIISFIKGDKIDTIKNIAVVDGSIYRIEKRN